MPAQSPANSRRSPAIELEHVTKRYRTGGGITDVSLSVAAGEVFGFLGPNGAGKSTTIRLLVDLIRPASGRISILGLDSHRDSLEVRRHLGYLPGELSLFDRLTGRQVVGHLAALRGPVDWLGIAALAERLSLDLDRPVRELSRGNKQKVGLVQALMGTPDVVVLDEPTSGLDPLVQREVHELIGEMSGRGCAVFLSSHLLSEVARIADRVGILRDGHLVTTTSVVGLRSITRHRVQVRTAVPLAAGDLAEIPGIESVEQVGTTCQFEVAGSMDRVIKVLARHEVLDVEVHEPDLEEAFMAYYEAPSDAEATHAGA